MKACVIYGPRDLRLEERPVPEPGPGMVRLRLAYAGICGSDLHYYQHGRVGNAVITEPMVLGHELSAVVDAVGQNVQGLRPGQHVTVNPSDECGVCVYCRGGRQNLCPSLRYFGSAARIPHVQGIMQQYPLVQARQCIVLADSLPLEQAACIEPLAIALHAAAQAGNMLGQRVFISGAGPVGCLIAAAARLNGAREVVISDVQPFPLDIAARMGADRTLAANDTAALAGLENSCAICFEASGSTAGMNAALRAVSPGGCLVHVGFLPQEEVAYPVNTMLIRKEVAARGSLRAYQEFPLAADLLASGRLDVSPMITGVFPLEQTEEALIVAADKTRSMKVLLRGEAS